MLLLKAFCATQANTVPLIFFFLCVCGVCFFLWFLFCLFCCFFFSPLSQSYGKGARRKNRFKGSDGSTSSDTTSNSFVRQVCVFQLLRDGVTC